MNNTKKLLIIGVGGVGSWLAWFLYNSKLNKQLNDLDITLADGDTVDTKNLGYQKFDKTDLLDNKAYALGIKYNFDYIDNYIKITEKNLKNFDCIISAVDSTSFRRDFFNYVFNINKNIYWIDLRSEGRNVAAFCKNKNNTHDEMLKTLPTMDIEEGSCQLNFELNMNILQEGNKIIASIGNQLILNWVRDETNIKKFIQRF